MDNAVALVQSYLRLNGYFTVTEFPVIATRRDGGYRTATDLDVLAFRFPGAGHIVPGRRLALDQEHLVVDEILHAPQGRADMLIGEVKEGRGELNAAVSDPAVLRAVLAGFGCCSREDAPRIAERLLRDGHAQVPGGHHIRIVIFASVVETADTSRHLMIPLGHIVRFLRDYVDEHWEMLRHSDSKDPAFGFLMTLAKAEKGEHRDA